MSTKRTNILDLKEKFQKRHEDWDEPSQRDCPEEKRRELWIQRLYSCWPVLETREALDVSSVFAMGYLLSSEAAWEDWGAELTWKGQVQFFTASWVL